jgi:tartrate-resistant acid phosphatase type 5
VKDYKNGTLYKYQENCLKNMEELAKRIKIKGIISVGDNIYPNGVDTINDPLWKTNYENVYNTPNLEKTPWYVILGNHDYEKNETAQIEYSKINKKWNMENNYYLKIFELNEIEKIAFIFIDTNQYDEELRLFLPNLAKTNRTKQFEWFKDTIENLDSTIKYKFVVGHHPIYGY